MTDTQIKQQLEALKYATDRAMKSKESARKFLVDAGIIKDKSGKPTIAKSKV